MDKILYNSENALTITTKLKKKQNQTISLGTSTYVIKLFFKRWKEMAHTKFMVLATSWGNERE